MENEEIIAFGDIDTQNGYLDRLFVHKNHQHQGIATMLCSQLETASHSQAITTQASITTLPIFLYRGYRLLKKQQVIRSRIALTNYLLEKKL